MPTNDPPTMTHDEPPGFDAALYDADFFTWTQRQAAALRAMPPDALGKDVDIAHVAEEIEDLGKRDLREVESYLGRLFDHLVKIDAEPMSRDVQHWRNEARLFAGEAARRYSRSMRQLLDEPGIWQYGIDLAEGYLADRKIAYVAPAACPFSVDEVLERKFDLDAALAGLAAARDMPRP